MQAHALTISLCDVASCCRATTTLHVVDVGKDSNGDEAVVYQVEAGTAHTCVLTNIGVKCFGDASNSKLGYDGTDDRGNQGDEMVSEAAAEGTLNDPAWALFPRLQASGPTAAHAYNCARGPATQPSVR